MTFLNPGKATRFCGILKAFLDRRHWSINVSQNHQDYDDYIMKDSGAVDEIYFASFI